MTRMKVASCVMFVCLLSMLSCVVQASTYKVRIPHWIEFVCEEGSGYEGYFELSVAWNEYPGALSYYSHSFSSYWWSSTHESWDFRRYLCGGTPVYPGECIQKELENDPSSYYRLFEVYAELPMGALHLDKTDDVYGMARPGDQITYTLTYKNTGRGPLEGCIVEETWPEYMEYITGGNPSGPNSVTWNFGTILPGHWRQEQLILRISEDLPREMTEIYNVAVMHPDPDITPTPAATPWHGHSSTSAMSVAHCDALRCSGVYGSAEWIDRPDATEYESLAIYDIVRGNDEVRWLDGYASFNHTVASGALTLSGGGLRVTDCAELPADVIGEIVLYDASSIEHSVYGLSSAAGYVKVVGQFLSIELRAAHY
ncbi:DUF11 domain-containing protein, partial [bacterium]|nr:DUF11 domain-containing protein [candidate division CSSED10-310 bacterium]